MRNDKSLKNRSGAVLVLVIVSMIGFVACAALVIDLAMYFNARNESQRATDAAALAGAYELMTINIQPSDSIQAVQRARDFAQRNYVRSDAVAASEVTGVEVIRDSSKVRVWILRPAVGLWFARAFGRDSMEIGSMSAARTVGSGTVGCLKPFGTPIDINDIPQLAGQRIRIYSTGDNSFVFIGFGAAQPGLGNIEPDISVRCNNRTARITLAEPWVWAAPDDQRSGQVRNGYDNMFDADPYLTYVPGSPGRFERSGVTVTDWRASVRIGNVALLDKSTIQPEANGTYQVKVAAFATVFFDSICKGSSCICSNGQACNGSHTQIFGRLFPAIGQTDNCQANGTCANGTFRLRLVQ